MLEKKKILQCYIINKTASFLEKLFDFGINDTPIMPQEYELLKKIKGTLGVTFLV